MDIVDRQSKLIVPYFISSPTLSLSLSLSRGRPFGGCLLDRELGWSLESSVMCRTSNVPTPTSRLQVEGGRGVAGWQGGRVGTGRLV